MQKGGQGHFIPNPKVLDSRRPSKFMFAATGDTGIVRANDTGRHYNVGGNKSRQGILVIKMLPVLIVMIHLTLREKKTGKEKGGVWGLKIVISCFALYSAASG